MSVTTAPFTAADLAATIPEIWSDIVNEPLFPKAVLSNFVTDLSDYMSEGGDIVHVPNIYTNIFTASTQSTQGAEVTTQDAAQVDVTLTVNQHKYIAWLIGDKDMKQLARKYKLNEKYAKEAQNVLIINLEDALFALYSSLTTTGVGNPANPQADLDVRQAIRTLDNASFDLDDCAFFVSPVVYWDQLSGITKYYSQYASDLNLIRTGNFGMMDRSRGYKGELYAQAVYTSPRVVTTAGVSKGLFLNRSAFGYAIQNQGDLVDESGQPMNEFPRLVRVQAEYQLRNLGMLTVADMVYGVGVLRSDAGVVLSALATGSVA